MTEEVVQLLTVNFLNSQYPNTRFIANYLSGAKLPIYLAKRARQLGQASSGCPDMLIFHNNGKYSGLALELKKPNTTVYKLNGDLRASEHLERQQDYLHYLNNQGWYASFSVGFEDTVSLITKYMSNEL